MNKNDYIEAVDNITAPDSLKERIMKDKKLKSKSGKNTMKYIAAVAACLVVIVGITSISSIKLGSKNSGIKEVDHYDSYGSNSEYKYTEDSVSEDTADEFFTSAYSTSLLSKTETNRKIIKNADLSVETKDFDKFISALDKKVDSFKGYTDSYEEENYANKRASIVIRIPAENLEKFLSGIEEIGTVQSKNISKSDVTDNYIDIESHIKALDTEEAALLKILANCQTVSETIEVQSRLSEVRAEAERYKSQKKSLDSKISYSTVTIDISEEERIVKTDGSFSAELKNKFSDSLYNIGSFFRNLALTVLGDILYILLFGAVIAVVIVIIVKRKKKREQ